MLRLLNKLALGLVCLLICTIGVARVTFASPVEGSTVETFISDLEFLKTKTEAVLYFVPFGSNPDDNFRRYNMSDEQVLQVCGGAQCGGFVGANFGTFYKGGRYDRARQFGMTWTLEIGRNGEAGNAAGVINDEGIENVIIRIGTANDSSGFGNENGIDTGAYINYLREVASQTDKTFYAIAGPNEPDIESWAHKCENAPNGPDDPNAQAFYNCVAGKLAPAMNEIINAGLPSNVRLLSPAWNMTTFMFQGLMDAMDAAGANFSGLYGMAGNIYPAGQSIPDYWASQDIDTYFGKYGIPIIITETAFDANGNPGGDGDGPGYDTSPFNYYDGVTGDDFYIHPINGINDEASAMDDAPDSLDPTHIIREDLIRQGYEAICATQGFKIKMTKYGEEWMDHYLDERNSDIWRTVGDGVLNHGIVLGGQNHYFPSIRQLSEPLGNDRERLEDDSNFPIFSRVTVDYKDARIPVFRDVEDKQWLMASLEEYFGHKDSVMGELEDRYSYTEMHSAPINSLLSDSQRCAQVVYNVRQQDAMCQKLANPSACTLYRRTIQGADMTVKEVLDGFAQYQSSTGLDVKTSCEQLMGRSEEELAAVGLSNLKRSVEMMPLHIDRSYRLAFLVTVIQLRGSSTDTMFNFFTKPSAGTIPDVPMPQDEVLITAFKVPDITTNKGTIRAESGANEPAVGPSENVEFDDPSVLTRNTLLTKPQTEVVDNSGEKVREQLFMMARDTYDPRGANPRVQDSKLDEIFCAQGQSLSRLGTEGVNSPACKDPLGMALVQLINAQVLLEGQEVEFEGSDIYDVEYALPDIDGCGAESDDILFEEAFDINDAASLHELGDDSHVFTNIHGAAILENLMNIVTNFRGDNSCGPTSEFDPNYSATQADHKGSCPQIAPENWGLKTFFHVVPPMQAAGWPYNDSDERTVKHFLVYPEGYDLKMLEDVLAGTFFATSQQEELRRVAENYDRIQITDDIVIFEGGSRKYEYSDSVNNRDPGQPAYHADFEFDDPIGYETLTRGDGATREFPIYECGSRADWDQDTETDPWGNTYTDYDWIEPVPARCWREFGMATKQASAINHARILGARLGYWTRTIQKSFHRLASVPRTYLESCNTTEQYLLGKCGTETGQPIDPDGNATGNIDYPVVPGGNPNAAESDISQCLADGKATLNVDANINDDRTWNVSISCNGCNGTWGDLGVTVNGLFVGINSLGKDSTLVYPCNGCAYEGHRLPETTTETEFCFNVNITHNYTDNQCSVSPFNKTICKNYGPTTTGLGDLTGPPLGELNYYDRTPLPATGEGTYYGSGLMNQVLRNRQAWNQIDYGEISNCELSGSTFESLNTGSNNGYVGCVAMLRRGDVPFVDNPGAEPRKIWIQKPSGAEGPDVVGPFLVIDVAASGDAPRLFARGWVVDIDYATWARWFPGDKWGPNNRPQQVTILDRN